MTLFKLLEFPKDNTRNIVEELSLNNAFKKKYQIKKIWKDIISKMLLPIIISKIN